MKKGDRVQLHPACDEWMQGDRYGTVAGFGRLTYISRDGKDLDLETSPGRKVIVKLDRSGRVRRFHPDNLFPID